MISIIIPTHNSEHFVLNTIKSLQIQTDQNFEIVFVDDNSKDSTIHLIEEFKLKNKDKVQILTSSKNIGPGGARNLGIKSAKGEFIVFLDSDDTLTNDAIRELNKIIATKPIDCLFFDALSVKNTKNTYLKTLPFKNEVPISREIAIALSSGGVCGKLYRKSIITDNKIEFPSIMRHEDFVFNKLVISKCLNFGYLQKALYGYFQREESLTHSIHSTQKDDSASAFKIVEEELLQDYPKEVEFLFIQKILYHSIMSKLTKEATSSLNRYLKQRTKRYPEWHRNKYLNLMPSHQKIFLFLIKNNIFYIAKYFYFAKKCLTGKV